MIIVVVDHDPEWAKEFEKESEILQHILGDILINIHHIGSTAVPGLMAKPIIDILLDVTDLDRLDSKRQAFENLGYEVMGEMGIPGRRYFRKGGDKRTHHIHAFKSGDPNLTRHLAFRDYLMEYKDVAEEYGTLKFNIAKRIKNEIEKYSDQKDAFVKFHEARALKWYANGQKNQ